MKQTASELRMKMDNMKAKRAEETHRTVTENIYNPETDPYRIQFSKGNSLISVIIFVPSHSIFFGPKFLCCEIAIFCFVGLDVEKLDAIQDFLDELKSM